MPSTILPGQACQVRVLCQSQQQSAYNITYVGRPSTATGDATTTNLLDALVAALASPYSQLLSSSAQIRGYGVSIHSTTPPGPVDWRQAITAGIATGNELPKQVCGLLRFLPTDAPQRVRGRIYIPFPTDNNNAATAKPDGSYLSLLTTLGNVFTSPLSVTNVGGTTESWTWSVYSKQHAAYYPIGSTTPVEAWATQRRRGDFGRQNVPPV